MPGAAPSKVEIGIGLTVHDAVSHLAEALDALLAQSHREFRVLALDDGSSDGSGEILRRYAALDPRLDVVTEPRRTGLIRAWRRVAELVRDRFDPSYFAWYSDHDTVSADWLEKLLTALREDGSIVCAYAPARRVSATGAALEHEALTYDSSGMGIWERIEASAGVGSGPLGAGDVVYGLFRRDALERCGIFRDELLPDRLLVSEIQLHGGIRCVREASRSRRVSAETYDLDETLARQLRRLFPDGVRPSHPTISHLTALLRTSLDPRREEEPELRFRRSLQAWLYLIRQCPRFLPEAREELARAPWPGDDHLRAYLEYRAGGLPIIVDGGAETAPGRGPEDAVRRPPARTKAERLREELDATVAENELLRHRVAQNQFLRGRVEQLRREIRWTRGAGILATFAIRGRRLLRSFRARRAVHGAIPRPRILHVVPTSLEDPALRYHGTTKDIRGRIEYFSRRDMEVERLVTPRDEDSILIALHGRELASFGGILIDVPGHSYPEVLRHLRRAAPEAVLLVRSFNAEGPHRLDWMRAAPGIRDKARYLLRGCSMAGKDVETSFLADKVIAISDHDARSYWDRFSPRGKVSCVPYFIPEEYRASIAPGVAKELRCVALGSTARTPMIDEAARSFLRVVAEIGEAAPEWSFSITGELDPSWTIPRRVEAVGLLESPFEELCRCRAMALLSDRGRGFKTKILDAFEARAYVLLPPRLFRRLPEEVRPICIPVRPRAPGELLEALERCREPYPEVAVNDQLRDRAFRALDAALGIAAGRPEPAVGSPAGSGHAAARDVR